MESKVDRGPIVVYNSKTGFTAKYALWIAEYLECPFITLKEANVSALQHYETIVFGGWLLGGKIQGLEFIAKNFEHFENQNIVVFCTGSAKGQDMTALRKNNLTEKLENLSLYSFVSGLNYEKMGFGHKTMLKMFVKALKARNLEKEAERLSKSFDESNPELVKPLVEEVKSLERK